MLLSPCLAATAARARPPTPDELRAAHAKVEATRHQVASLQVRAERAAEAYNGAISRAQQAARTERLAQVAAVSAQAAFDLAQGVAVGAQAAAEHANQLARLALAAQQRAEAEAAAAQLALNRMAAGAFQTGGQLGMAARLFVAHDPLELANGRNLMNQVGAYQQKIIVTLHVARNRAVQATQRATAAQSTAVAASLRATTALAATTTAKNAADSARAVAAGAAHTTKVRLNLAAVARQNAQALVNQAEAALGSAKRSAASLERSAAAARAEANGVTSGQAPSDAAATAIHWAFQEIGVPYSWGGGDENGPTRGFAQGANTVGFDCSGLTLFIYHKAGIQLDHYTGSQWNVGRRINSRADLEPGDLMFFAYDTSRPETIHHVSIYLGNGRMIEAPQTGDVVKVSSAIRDDFIGGTRPWQN
jgi:cell wall-associated NlpC family hydrolase